MDPKIQQQILDGLAGLAQKLGVAAGALWGMFVRQAVIGGIECMVGAAIAMLAFGFLLRLSVIIARKNKGYALPPRFWVSGAFSVGSAIAFLVCLVNGIDLLANPGYWAFQSLIHSVL